MKFKSLVLVFAITLLGLVLYLTRYYSHNERVNFSAFDRKLPVKEMNSSSASPQASGGVETPLEISLDRDAKPQASTANAKVKSEITRRATAARDMTTLPAISRTSRAILNEAPETFAQEDVPEARQPIPGPVGIRLAPDVRLPVAAYPIDYKISPVAQEALEQIVTDYYSAIAAASAENPGTVTEEEPENGELTRIVTNGPDVEAARSRADDRFRALFGNAAYNRMSINTLLESRLPANPGE